ncbi:MAG TPA: hypothetical protein P5136_00990 [Methanofastidiosum sp.]|nr:hypothetical protein [Methanofastidiosum sp.]
MKALMTGIISGIACFGLTVLFGYLTSLLWPGYSFDSVIFLALGNGITTGALMGFKEMKHD